MAVHEKAQAEGEEEEVPEWEPLLRVLSKDPIHPLVVILPLA